MSTIAPDQIPSTFEKAMNTRDTSVFDTFISAEQYINHNPWVENGIENMKPAIQSYLDAFPDLKVEIEDHEVVGDLVIAHIRYTGTQATPYAGTEPTGRAVRMRSTDVWRVENGLAVEHWDNVTASEFVGGE